MTCRTPSPMLACVKNICTVSKDIPGRCAYLAQFGTPVDGKGGTVADRVSRAIRRISYVQIDTISVVERAHHHVLWSRDHAYRAPVLDELESGRRDIFEYWAHAAAYLPLSDYRYCLPRMKRVKETGHEWFPTDASVVDAVRDRIRSEGALRSQDFASEGTRGPWWDWKPAKAALEYLFMSGELMITSRKGFQKLYDLTERVLPPDADASFPSAGEMSRWYLDYAIRALGCFRERDLAYGRRDGISGLEKELAKRLESGSLLPLTVEGKKAERWYASPEALETAGRVRVGRRVRILSPFDNLIIDRKRAEALYGFRYTIECYVPQTKRQFGYFSLPVFWGSSPVGTIDCKADRAAKTLFVKSCAAMAKATRASSVRELYKTDYEGFKAALPEAFGVEMEQELQAFAQFNGCEKLSTVPNLAGGDS